MKSHATWWGRLLGAVVLAATLWTVGTTGAIAQPDREEAKVRLRTTNSLFMHALGLESFQNQNDQLPPVDGPTVSEKLKFRLGGVSGLSWRAYIVPSLSSDRNTAKDATHVNDWVLGKLPAHKSKDLWNRPDVVRIPYDPFTSPYPERTKEPWLTCYRVFVGGGAAFEKGRATKLTPADFPDGLENTLLVVEAAEMVPWPKPDELAYDPTRPLPNWAAASPTGITPRSPTGRSDSSRPRPTKS